MTIPQRVAAFISAVLMNDVGLALDKLVDVYFDIEREERVFLLLFWYRFDHGLPTNPTMLASWFAYRYTNSRN